MSHRAYPFLTGLGPVPSGLLCTTCGVELGDGEGLAWRCPHWLAHDHGCQVPERRSPGGWHGRCLDTKACHARWRELPEGERRRERAPCPRSALVRRATKPTTETAPEQLALMEV